MRSNITVRGNSAIKDSMGGLELGRMGTREVLGIIIRRRWIILSIALPIILLSLFATINATESVTARAQVVVEGKQPEDPSFGVSRVDYTVMMSSASQIAVSIPVAERAASALWDSVPALLDGYPDLDFITTKEDLRDLILGCAGSTQVGETNILEISISHPSPKFSLAAVGAVTDAYISYSVERRQNKPAVEYYTEQIGMVKAGLDSLMAERAAVLNRFGLLAFRENASATAHSLIDLERLYLKARTEREAKERRLQVLKETVAEDPFFTPRGNDDDPELFTIKQMLNKQESQLIELKQEYTENSEFVKRQTAVVGELRNKFIRARDDFIRGLEIELEVAKQSEIGSFESYQNQKQLVANYPHAQQQVESINLEVNTQLDLLELLQTKKGEVRLQAGMDSRISNILPLNTPSLDEFFGGGKKFLYLALAGIFGLSLGLLAAFFVENQDHRVLVRSQIVEHFEIPVLGTISRTEKVQ